MSHEGEIDGIVDEMESSQVDYGADNGNYEMMGQKSCQMSSLKLTIVFLL